MTALRSLWLPVVGSLVVLTRTSPAQYYWPAGYVAAPGNAVMNAPFTTQPGYPVPGTRCMVVIDPASLPFPIGTVLTRISLRRDTSHATQGYAAETGNLIVKIGRAVATPSQIQDVQFSRVWDGQPTQVFAQAPFVVPAAAAPGTSVPPFNVVIPFTTNFTWQGGPLAIDFLFTASTGPSPWRVDAFAVDRPQTGTGRPAGGGCRGSNGFIPFHFVLPETAMPGAQLTVQMEGSRLPPYPGAPESFAYHLLGLQNSTFLGSPLPMPLTAFGGPPGCFLRVDPQLTIRTVVSSPSALFARATNAIAVPAHPALVGAVIYSQWLLFDTGLAQPLPVTVSDAQAITLGDIAPPPATLAARTIWKYGATGFDDDYGRMVPDDYGPILRFN